MTTNADITIYNVKANKETRLPEYHRTQITGIHWYTDQKVDISDKGLSSADLYKIRIPEDAGCSCEYVAPEVYQALDDVTGHWTIQNGDIFVKGIVSDEIRKASELFQKYPNSSGKVMSWSDNRRGSLPHWRIGGAS